MSQKVEPMIRLEFDWSFLSSQVVGQDHGLDDDDLARYSHKVEGVWKKLIEERDRSRLAFWNILESDLILKELRDVEKVIRGRDWDNVLLLGIGGSALGATAIFRAIKDPFHNLVSRPRFFVMDNVDPVTFSSAMDVLDWEKTLVLVVSKSGSTAETLSQFLIVREALKKAVGKSAVRDHVIIITDPEKGILRSIARDADFPSCSVPPLLGGRFSVLSSVGLLPALCMGVDVEMLWMGAFSAAKEVDGLDPMSNPAVRMALYQFIFDSEKKKPIHVYWAYADALYSLSDWIRQLIAESIGKRRSDGSSVGITPVKALGVTDQHSQLQLYREGPNDKVIIFLGVRSWRRDLEIPHPGEGENALKYLGGHTLGELLHVEQKATACALAEAGRPNMTLWFPILDEFTLGQAFFLFELQTAFMGFLYGINPFDQPGVELSKLMTYGIMGREGFEEYARVVERFASWKS